MFREKLEEFKASNDKKNKITQIILKKVNDNTTCANYLSDKYFDRIANAGSYAKQEIDKIIEEHGGRDSFQKAALEYIVPPQVDNILAIPIRENTKKTKSKDEIIAPFHLYMPWNPGYCETQMFDLKKSLKANGTTHIPKLNKTKGKDPYSQETLELLKKQIESGVETRLYMTDFRSIHVWKISDIIWNESEVNSILNLDSTLDFYKGIHKNSVIEKHEENPFEFWMKVDDLFVLWVDHEQSMREFLDHLSTLSECDPSNPFYNPEKKITPYRSGRYPMPVASEKINETIFKATYYVDSAAKEDGKAAIPSRWLNTHRQVTKEYLLMQSYLEKHIYPELWPYFCHATRHYLTEFEMLRVESSDYLSIRQRLQFYKQVFDCLLSAVLNSLHKEIGEKFISLFSTSQWNELDSILRGKKNDNFSLLPLLPTNDQDVADISFYSKIDLLIDSIRKLSAQTTNEIVRNKLLVFSKEISPLNNFFLKNKLSELRITRNWFAHNYYEMISGENEQLLADNLDNIARVIDLLSVAHSKESIFYIIYSSLDSNLKQSFNNDDICIQTLLKSITNDSKLSKTSRLK